MGCYNPADKTQKEPQNTEKQKIEIGKEYQQIPGKRKGLFGLLCLFFFLGKRNTVPSLFPFSGKKEDQTVEKGQHPWKKEGNSPAQHIGQGRDDSSRQDPSQGKTGHVNPHGHPPVLGREGVENPLGGGWYKGAHPNTGTGC